MCVRFSTKSDKYIKDVKDRSASVDATIEKRWQQMALKTLRKVTYSSQLVGMIGGSRMRVFLLLRVAADDNFAAIG